METLDENNPACALAGRVLNNRWRVLNRVDVSPGGTGGKYSIRYIVEDVFSGEKAFLKALNYKAFFAMARDRDPVKIVSFQNSVFEYERSVLERCRGERLSRVTKLYDTGTEYVENAYLPAVPYLIFEMADGDVRTKIDFSNKLDMAWKLKSLHHVAVGLKQLHGVGIGHQDLKPSNVLLYDDGLISKIADLGNSLCSDIKSPYDNGSGRFVGDSDYIPIEYLYGYKETDTSKRQRATDMYLFGNLVCFYFTGLNMTSLIIRNVDRQFRWNNWKGDYRTVREYLMPGYYKALNDVERSISSTWLAKEISEMIGYCCFPYPEERGHPDARKLIGNKYDFHRIYTRLNVLLQRTELALLNGDKL